MHGHLPKTHDHWSSCAGASLATAGWPSVALQEIQWGLAGYGDREKILAALREKPLKIYEIMRRTNVPNEESCRSLLLTMRDEGSVKFDIHKGQWLIG